MPTLNKKTQPVNAVLIEPVLPLSDWIAGVSSGIEYNGFNIHGNWVDYQPTDERQNRGIETWTCTNQWGNSSFETQLIFRLRKHLLTQATIDFLEKNKYFDENGKPNFSDKFAAIKTGTVYGVGNYVTYTPKLAREVGLIPESMLPFGNPKTWEEFINPKQITPEMMALAGKFKEIFAVEFEHIPVTGLKSELRERIRYHLKQAPLSLAIPICPGYKTDNPIKSCSKNPIHCVGLMGDFGDKYPIYDSYDPFLKYLEIAYNMPYVLKSIIYEKGGYSQVEILEAQKFALQISKNNNTEYIFRPDAHGEAYYIDRAGDIFYKHQPGGKLMDNMISVTRDITPVSEKDWNVLKAALKK